MDRLHDRVHRAAPVSASAFSATVAVELGPDASKGRQRAVLIQSEQTMSLNLAV